jgi:hypothetical protein
MKRADASENETFEIIQDVARGKFWVSALFSFSKISILFHLILETWMNEFKLRKCGEVRTIRSRA